MLLSDTINKKEGIEFFFKAYSINFSKMSI